MRLVIPDQLNLSDSIFNTLARKVNLTIYKDRIFSEDEIIKRIENAEIITVNFFDLTRKIIENSPNLKYVIVPAVGYDWIDIDACNEKGIKVLNCPTFNSNSVAEHAIALMFSVSRRIVEANRHIINYRWNPSQFEGIEVSGKSLLTIGYGNIGKKIYNLAKNLGMNVDFANSRTSDAELKNKIKDSDVVVLCYPLNQRTKGSFGKEKIDLLKKNAILINVGRGLLIDQDYLKLKLENKEIFGAGLDVFNSDETLTEGRQDIVELATLDNVVATPHIGFNSKETYERLGSEIIENINSIIEGKPKNVVNP